MAAKKENLARLKRFALDQGFSLFGVADVSGIREEFNLAKNLIREFDRGISLGKRIIDAVLEDISDRPTPLYFHHYRQINFFLDRAAFLISCYLQEQGFKALPIPASQVIDWEKHRAHLSHKRVGFLAGLGWIGRNNLLVNPQLGARFRLVTVLTDMPLEPDKPLDEDCRSCRKCLEPCPAKAIKANKDDFDYMSCFEKLKEFRKMEGISQYICGVCVKACSGRSPD